VEYELEELRKFKRRAVGEIDELYGKLKEEREGQKSMQRRIEELLEEVSYLKAMASQYQ